MLRSLGMARIISVWVSSTGPFPLLSHLTNAALTNFIANRLYRLMSAFKNVLLGNPGFIARSNEIVTCLACQCIAIGPFQHKIPGHLVRLTNIFSTVE